MDQSIQRAEADISETRNKATTLKAELAQLQQDVDDYRKVDTRIGNLQKEFLELKQQVVDFGQRDVRARKFIAEGAAGPSSLAFGILGCPPIEVDAAAVAYCAQGSPPALYEYVPATRDLRPVASLSSMGFQDTSAGPKPKCTEANRGTLYVEKGSGNVSDRPFICIKTSTNVFA